MKAVILAAGEGRRLKPLTEVRPKPMLPVGNRPLLEYVVEAVADAGIDKIVLVIGYKRERIQSHFEDGDDWGVDIEYAIQETQLGTGHAILQVEPYIDGPFLVLNGDRILESAAITDVREAATDAETRIAVTRSEQPSDYGVVEVDGDEVRSITEKPPRYAAASKIINAGVYRFEPSVFKVISATETEGELTITAALQRLLKEERIHAVRYDGIWLDVSYPWDYLAVNADVLERFDRVRSVNENPYTSSYIAESVAVGDSTAVQPNASVFPGTSLGDNVSIGPNAVVANSVILSDATVGAGAVLTDCVIGENVTIGPNTTVEGGEATVRVDGDVHEGVRLGGVVGDNSRLGGNVTVAPGTVVGTGTRVETGCWLQGRIPSDADVRRG